MMMRSPGMAGVLAVVAGAALAGCSSTTPPDQLARITLAGGETMQLRVEGPQPVVQLVPGYGPLKQVQWVRGDQVTTFSGVAAGGDLLLIVGDGDVIRFTDHGGTSVEILMWNTTRYILENVPAQHAAAE